MAKDKEKCKDKCCISGLCKGKPCNPIYCLGLIGAAIYFISNATGFWVGVLGFLKAIVWPVFLVMELFEFLGM